MRFWWRRGLGAKTDKNGKEIYKRGNKFLTFNTLDNQCKEVWQGRVSSANKQTNKQNNSKINKQNCKQEYKRGNTFLTFNTLNNQCKEVWQGRVSSANKLTTYKTTTTTKRNKQNCKQEYKRGNTFLTFNTLNNQCKEVWQGRVSSANKLTNKQNNYNNKKKQAKTVRKNTKEANEGWEPDASDIFGEMEIYISNESS